MAHREPLIGYRLRVVRTGVWATFLVIAGLALYPLLPHRPEVDLVPYMTIMGAAVAGAVVIVLLPWRRLFEGGLGMWLLYAWSVLDILLITAAIPFSGGAHAEFFWVYVLTSFFMASSYPPRAQVALLGFTVAAYLGVLALTGAELAAGDLVLRFSVLGTLVFMTSFLSRELLRQTGAHLEARQESERRAALLGTVARSARAISLLSSEEVLRHVTESVAGLGFEACNFDFFEESTGTYRVAHAHGLPKEYVEGTHPADHGMPGLVRRRRETVVVDDYGRYELGIPVLQEAGFRVAVASPVWVHGQLDGALVAGSRRAVELTPEEIEAFELLAAQAGRALENARAFEEQRRTVEQLAELDRLKRDFVSNVSHELRTPLTVISGMGATLADNWGRLDEEKRLAFIDRINANAGALDSVIATLLDFSRLESGRLEVHPQPVDVGELVDSVATRLGSMLEAHAFETDILPGVAVHADRSLLERILENLLSNAAKYTPAGTRVTLSTEPLDGGRVRVVVTDEGPGIPSDELEHLGERFFRGGEDSTRYTKGTGLGLAFVAEVLALHGSELEISSDVGRWSRFAFALPEATMDLRIDPAESAESRTTRTAG